jgi:4-alpha-glucanotransferase
MSKVKTTHQLRELLHHCRVQIGYEDVTHRRRRASVDSLLVLLRSLGVSIDEPSQAGELLQARRRERLERSIEPVVVDWDGRAKPVPLSLPASVSGWIDCELEIDCEIHHCHRKIEDLSAVLDADDETFEFVTHRFPLPRQLPMGYHTLRITVGERVFESLVISAPRRAFAHGEDSAEYDPARPAREWASFLPLYSLRTERDWGAGDFTALGDLAEWTGKLGGAAVGTLPLLAASLNEPFEPSPYRPVSRQFWNEFYIDVEAIPELHEAASARELVDSSEFRRRLQELRAGDLVDYRETMRLKRQILLQLSKHFFNAKPPRFADFQRFVKGSPEVEHYARFRAAADRRRTIWQQWPSAMHERIEQGDFDPDDRDYHLYSQWIAAEQLQSLEQRAAKVGSGLYLDLPVGVDPSGYDVWRHQHLYVAGARAGSPPDPVFTRGQDWGLPPLHPERIREDRYQHLRSVLSAYMNFGRYLRIDHALGWHRLFAIPPGLGPSQGAYIRYRAEEFYAVASLESHRHHCILLAENMGTVPPVVNRTLARRGIGGMWVAPYELEPQRRRALTAPAELSVASLNTHDMPPLAAWWQGDDIADRQSLGLIEDREAAQERADREKATHMLRDWLRTTGTLPLDEEEAEIPAAALLRSLAVSPAQLVLINLEDLWLETRPQNVPGTSTERPNWLRKARYSLEEFRRLPHVLDTLEQVDSLRRRIEKPR